MTPGKGYDYRLRVKLGETGNEPLKSHVNRNGDYFGWYEGEVIVLEVRHKDHTLSIKLDEKGNVSLKRSINQRKQNDG
jgi:hypothetical protein